MSTALTLCCATQLPYFKRDSFAATSHSCEFIPVTLMEGVQASVGNTKVKMSNADEHATSIGSVGTPFSKFVLCF